MCDARGQGERYYWLAEALREDGIVLTASRRLARELRTACNEQRLAAGALAWATPCVFYWKDWIGELLVATADAAAERCIGASASALLWERHIRRHLDADVLSIGSLTRHALAAWQRLADWRVPLDAVATAARSSDECLFARAASDYARALTEHGWIDPWQAPAVALERLAAGRETVPRRVHHAGFDRTTPLVADFFGALEQRGSSVVAAATAARRIETPVASFRDTAAELRAAGRWARQILLRDPEARVAIVSADLDTEAPRQRRFVAEGLVPGWQMGGGEHAVNVSFGRRLADYPAIAMALLCLRWTVRRLPSEDVSVVLRSPFIAGDTRAERARLDRRLRSLPDRPWSAAALADALAGSAAPEWLANVRRLAAMQIHASAQAPPALWAERLESLLSAIGWPGHGSLGSEEFQLVNRWRELLNEFTEIEVVAPQMTLTEAIGRLHALAREAVFQPEQGPGLVQLIGALEAAGMEFDHLWISGMDANRWPAAGNPLTLVSRRLQRERGMPDATPADTLEYSRRVLERLKTSARFARMSWARSEQDAVMMPSPLLAAAGVADDPGTPDPGWYAATLIGRAPVHTEPDDPLPGIAGIERVSGGARTVDLQRTEPFAAFAQGRLGVRELARYQSGLPANLRGSLLHDALHELYREHPSQSDIRRWSAQEARERIVRAVDRALSPSERRADAVLRRLLALERSRLVSIIQDFLDREIARQPFAIERVEERIQFEHAGAQLVLRADRIDRLPDGSLLIVDYKTGVPKNLLGRDGDPIESQLVLYAMALGEAIGGLTLVNVNRRAIDYRGVGTGIEWGSIAAGEWRAALGRWSEQVLEAIEAIARGDVRVNLKHRAEQRWQLDVLSRIEEERRAG